MWLVKGFLFGLLTSFLFTVAYLITSAWPPRPNRAIALSAIVAITTDRPLFWVALALIMVSSCVCANLLHSVYGGHS